MPKRRLRWNTNEACQAATALTLAVAAFPRSFVLQSWRPRALLLPLRDAYNGAVTLVRTGAQSLSEVLAEANARGCAAASDATEAAWALRDKEVLACFLERQEHGRALHTAWAAKLPELPSFDVEVRTEPGSTISLASALPPQLAPGGPLEAIGQQTELEAQALAQDFCDVVREASHSVLPKQLRIRLACVNYVQCSRLHWDDVPLRAVSVLAGAGTEVLPESRANREGLRFLESLPIENQASMSTEEWNGYIMAEDASRSGSSSTVLQAPSGWAVLLKGSLWGSGVGALHRSPLQASKRVLLQVDFSEFVDATDD
eukprot:TRINITY_DN66292_c0_g1_i1.p1 TRINITY_DN66292_c0_g1~~TRINITY_DN66292_c0_g1_i1.p1  ORF type:complete len:325 (-),score=58.04 TRINITY_DN66292_c0_g1_i1:32-979(-)